jgi:hypothetical protein
VTPETFAQDVAARCARIAEALADEDTILACSLLADLEHDARQLAFEFAGVPPPPETEAGPDPVLILDYCCGCGAKIVSDANDPTFWCDVCREGRVA